MSLISVWIGPTRLPVLGSVIQLSRANPVYPHIALTKFAEKYGDIMSFGWGSSTAGKICQYTSSDVRFFFFHFTKNEFNQDTVFIYLCQYLDEMFSSIFRFSSVLSTLENGHHLWICDNLFRLSFVCFSCIVVVPSHERYAEATWHQFKSLWISIRFR